jgi:hypothetical protein
MLFVPGEWPVAAKDEPVCATSFQEFCKHHFRLLLGGPVGAGYFYPDMIPQVKLQHRVNGFGMFLSWESKVVYDQFPGPRSKGWSELEPLQPGGLDFQVPFMLCHRTAADCHPGEKRSGSGWPIRFSRTPRIPAR